MSHSKHILEFFDGILDTHPMAPTSATPIYSNAAIQILAYALETITNKTYSSLLSEHLTEPLNLSHSTFSKPADGYGIIPVNATASGWNLDAGDETP
jgi:CubicO group peptidase (beta-lactamase class C family)